MSTKENIIRIIITLIISLIALFLSFVAIWQSDVNNVVLKTELIIMSFSGLLIGLISPKQWYLATLSSGFAFILAFGAIGNGGKIAFDMLSVALMSPLLAFVVSKIKKQNEVA
jgi:hypothetical protein